MTRTIVSFYKLLLSHQHKFSPFPQPEAAARVVTGQTGPQSCYHQNVILTLDWRGSSLLCCAPVLVCVSAYNHPALSPLCIMCKCPIQGESDAGWRQETIRRAQNVDIISCQATLRCSEDGGLPLVPGSHGTGCSALIGPPVPMLQFPSIQPASAPSQAEM